MDEESDGERLIKRDMNGGGWIWRTFERGGRRWVNIER
jgi:hypothetical protein